VKKATDVDVQLRALQTQVPCTHPTPYTFFDIVTGSRRSLSLKLSETRVSEPPKRARLGTPTHFCEVVDLRLRGEGGGGLGCAAPRSPDAGALPCSVQGVGCRVKGVVC